MTNFLRKQNNRRTKLSQDELDLFADIYNELLEKTKISQMDEYIQHGNTTTLLHSAAVAHYSYLFAKIFRINVNAKSLIVGAMLHDYYLYDWHIYDKSHSFHGFRHPYTALKNAKADFSLTKIEEDIIVRHMFPLTPIPPRYMESIIVCLMDKLCSIYETLSKNAYQKLWCKQLVYSIEENLEAV